jgi:hypothetical protein
MNTDKDRSERSTGSRLTVAQPPGPESAEGAEDADWISPSASSAKSAEALPQRIVDKNSWPCY